MWFSIDMLEGGDGTRFYSPMLGTGIAAAITGVVLLGVGGLMGAEWEHREIDISAAEGTNQAASSRAEIGPAQPGEAAVTRSR
jgi:hypothetical protein